jgi:hypothetical protein
MAIRRPKLDRKLRVVQDLKSGKECAPGWSFTIHCPYEGELVFNFTPYRRHGRDELAGHMRDAFWSLRHERVGRSLLSYEAHGLRYFWRFLDDLHAAGEPVTRLAQIDRTLLGHYLAWLDMQLSSSGPTRGQRLSLTAKRVSFNHLKAILENRRGFAPASLSHDFAFPRNPFPHANRLTPRRESYSPSEHKAIVEALNRDLRKIHDAEDGEPLPTLQVLIVHMMVFVLAVGWNLQTLIELRRDSLRDHPLPDRKLFVTFKRRGSLTQAMSIPDGTAPADHETLNTVPATVAEHFRFLCEFTAPLVGVAAPKDRVCAFLWQVPKLKNKGQVVRLDTSRIGNALRDFRDRHGLLDDRGQSLRLSIARMRPTMATELYRRTRDIRTVQQALGHSSPLTTAKHYANKPLESERDHAFVLDALVSRLTPTEIGGKVLVAADGKVPLADVQNLLSGGYNTGIARCRNPFREDDTVCQKYFTCFRCPNFCVFEDDLWRLFSFYERLLAERSKINSAHWMKTYGPIVRRIDAEIAPLFPAEKVEAARRFARERPHPAWRRV